jgi:diadenosine tetraphosphatase ApaH/serine/threonine PP2A family protein phosphatase
MEKKCGGKVFLNPGSVGQPRDGDSDACFMVFDTKNRTCSWYRVAYDVDAAAKSITEAGLPSFLAERLYSGR